MAFKIKNYGRAHIIGAALPNHADTYTVIKHEDVINLCINELEQAGFNIIGETYRATALGDIATGIYKVKYGNDPELGITLAWTNSYNKQVAFNCISGAYVLNSGNLMIGNYGTLNKFRRKHTGTADTDTSNSIKDQIAHAKMHFAALVQDKEKMEHIKLNRTQQAELLGVLFAKEDLLTPRQATVVKKLMSKPKYFYSGGSDSLWTFYNYVSESLQDTHPVRWLIDQRFFHEFIRGEFDLSNYVIPTEQGMNVNDIANNNTSVDPAQIDLEDSIAEVEAEHSVVDPIEDPIADEKHAEFLADQEMQEIKTEQVIEEREEEDDTPAHDEDQIAERIKEDEAAVAEVCDEPKRELVDVEFEDDGRPVPTYQEVSEEVTMNDVDLTKLKVDSNDEFDFEVSNDDSADDSDFDF